MAIHDIKTINPFFNDVWTGLKNFEVRKNDRNYKVGDGLHLLEYDIDGKYTGSFIFCKVKYVLPGGKYGIEEGYCVLGLDVLNRSRSESILKLNS